MQSLLNKDKLMPLLVLFFVLTMFFACLANNSEHNKSLNKIVKYNDSLLALPEPITGINFKTINPKIIYSLIKTDSLKIVEFYYGKFHFYEKLKMSNSGELRKLVRINDTDIQIGKDLSSFSFVLDSILEIKYFDNLYFKFDLIDAEYDYGSSVNSYYSSLVVKFQSEKDSSEMRVIDYFLLNYYNFNSDKLLVYDFDNDLELEFSEVEQFNSLDGLKEKYYFERGIEYVDLFALRFKSFSVLNPKYKIGKNNYVVNRNDSILQYLVEIKENQIISLERN